MRHNPWWLIALDSIAVVTGLHVAMYAERHPDSRPARALRWANGRMGTVPPPQAGLVARRPKTVTDTAAPSLPPGWSVEGPKFKDAEHYLSTDGDNPEAPWPGYGWPLGSECWYFVLEGHGWRLLATGLTAESAARRAEVIAAERTRDAD